MEDRLQELELRYTLQQDLLQQLNDTIARHDREIARLSAELDEQRSTRTNEPLPFDPNESPPHY